MRAASGKLLGACVMAIGLTLSATQAEAAIIYPDLTVVFSEAQVTTIGTSLFAVSSTLQSGDYYTSSARNTYGGGLTDYQDFGLIDGVSFNFLFTGGAGTFSLGDYAAPDLTNLFSGTVTSFDFINNTAIGTVAFSDSLQGWTEGQQARFVFTPGNVDITALPEPATLSLLAIGAAVSALARGRRASR